MIKTKEKRWYAVYTKYKSEKLVAEHLQAKNIEAFTPLLKKVKRYQKKTKTHFYPLINNYTFVKINEKERKKVLETKNVLGFLKIGSDLPHIPKEEINTLKRVVGENLEIDLFNSPDKIGEEVEIIQGALTGMKGQLVSVFNKSEFIIQLKQLGVHLKIGVHPRYLRKTLSIE